MARYLCRISTRLEQVAVFAYMSDVRNFERWDPGVVSSVQIVGDGAGPDSVYEVLTSNGGRENLFRYETVEYDPPRRFTIVGRKAPFTSTDVIEVDSADGGSIVTYLADLEMPFPLSLADRWLQRIFERIGDAAATGLAEALDGEWLR
jgi:hypothetical protein